MKYRLCIIAIIGAALALGGCSRSTPSGVDTAEQPISHRVEEGPVRATVTLQPRQVRTSGSVQLTVDVAVPAAASIEDLKLDESLPQDWSVTQRKHTTRSANAKERTERFEFTIEPYLPGHAEIKPFDITCDLKGDAGTSDDRVVLHSIAVPVEVVSEWPSGEAAREPAALRGVVEAPAAARPWWVWASMGGAALLAAALAAFLIARSRRPYIPEPIRKNAHDIALADLGRLIADQLIERGLYKPFYQRVSNILRRYIENRFGLRAPEQTTEEFLDASRSARQFNAGDLELLEEFLTHCDMVKFAEHVPDPTQMHSTLETVRAFINRTQSEDAIVEFPPVGHAGRAAEPVEGMA